MSWLNNNQWSALKNGFIEIADNKYELSTVNCGILKVHSGKLVCCDPFANMGKTGNAFVNVPQGEYSVIITLADVSDELDGSHIREAYASLVIGDVAKEVSRRFLRPTVEGLAEKNEIVENDEFIGFGVDAGTACFVDAEALVEGMPEEHQWNNLFDGDADSWFGKMDDPKHIRSGIANIKLPLTGSDNNLILFHSGWGDGYYPVIGGYDAFGNIVAIHIDFFVVVGEEYG
jgi:hypothetical protein